VTFIGGMTPRAIACPRCHAPVGEVCLTYVEPNAADDLATRVPLYCADRVDAAFVRLADLVAKIVTKKEEALNKRESHKQWLHQVVDHFVGDTRGPSFKEQLVDEILRVNDHFNNPSLDEPLNSGDGSYKP